MSAVEEIGARRSVQRARAEERIAGQRASFAAIAQAVEKAGFLKAARVIRREAESAVVRMQEITDEHQQFISDIDRLTAENEQLRLQLAKPGRRATDDVSLEASSDAYPFENAARFGGFPARPGDG